MSRNAFFEAFAGNESNTHWVEGLIESGNGKREALKAGADEVRLHESDNHCQDFVRAVRHRTATASPVGAAFQSDLISHLSDVCIRTGRKITWDPAREQIVDDEAASRMLDRPLRSPWRL